MSPDRSVSLYFPHRDWQDGDGNYTVDMRGGYEALDDAAVRSFGLGSDVWGHLWRFDVAKSFADVSRRGRGRAGHSPASTDLAPDARALLVDYDLKTGDRPAFKHGRYVFYEGKTRFRHQRKPGAICTPGGKRGSSRNAREDEWPETPSEDVLRGNRPNPFNPVTIIRYEIAETVPVAIRVYDVSGARVRDLYVGNRQPGIYELPWNATNDAGQPVASGIYFCR